MGTKTWSNRKTRPGYTDTIRIVNRVGTAYKIRARKKQLIWELTNSEIESLIKSNCYYCGISPSNTKKFTNGLMIVYSGIDRIDNEMGYTINNCVPCCKTCNVAKQTMAHNEFLNWIERVHVCQKLKNPF